MTPRVGSRIAHYRILELLGGGYKSFVVKARGSRLRRTVGIKFLRDNGRVSKRRFLREARALATIEHPNICAIHDYVELPDGDAFVVMPYYSGATLRIRMNLGPLPVMRNNYVQAHAATFSSQYS
jgi:serine/threonine protein kinase